MHDITIPSYLSRDGNAHRFYEKPEPARYPWKSVVNDLITFALMLLSVLGWGLLLIALSK